MENIEKFVRERLLPDKANAQKAVDQLSCEMRDYHALNLTLEAIETNGLKRLETRVNMGNEVFMHANIEDTSTVVAKMMDGLFATIPLRRALIFIPKKIEILQGRISALEQKMCDIQATIDIMLSSIDEFKSIL